MPTYSKKTLSYRRKFSGFKSTYHSLYIVFVFFGLLLGITFLMISASLQKQTIRQEAATPSNHALWALLPKKSLHHPLHIHGLQKQQIIKTLVVDPTASNAIGLTPQQIRAAYNLPSSGGSGTIAIVDAYNTPSIESDLGTFDTAFAIPSCTKANGCLTVHYQSSSPPPSPPAGTNWDIETTIDVEWAHAIAPNAKILLFEANSDTPQDLLAGVDYARNQTNTSVVSMSWVTQEFAQETQFESLFTSSHSVSFFAASGDQGTGENWPAASANVIAVGGTTLHLSVTNTVTSETAWSGSGGGLSQVIPEPGFQTAFGVPNANGKRAIPDVSLNADPNNSPYIVIVRGLTGAVGGTSVGTPIWAAMSTLNQLPITNGMLYQHGGVNYANYYRDIVQGTNGNCGFICTAHSGYDYITGLGSPLQLPQNPPAPSATSAPSPTFTITPTQTPTATITPLFTNTPTPTNTTTSTTPIPTGFLCHTVNAQDTIFQLTLGLHGVGTAGDNVNPNSGGNTSPFHPQRNITVTVLDNANQPVVTIPGCVNYYSPDGMFHGNIDMGHLANGNYLVSVKAEGYLEHQVTGIIQVQSQNTQIPVTRLVTGDINNDNQLDLLDYNTLIACFGSKQSTSTCLQPPTLTSAGADINDDGKVDGVDYNLFIRELSVQKGAQ